MILLCAHLSFVFPLPSAWQAAFPAHHADIFPCTAQYVYSGQTAVALYLDSKNNVVHCGVVDLSRNTNFIRNHVKQQYNYQPISVSRMLQVLLECQPLDAEEQTLLESTSFFNSCEDLLQDDTDVSPICGPASEERGPLASGTLWCGYGCNATDWSQLGENKEVDRCCRTHDLCPRRQTQDRVEVEDNALDGQRTILDCQCDQQLLSCLEAQHSMLATLVADVYQIVQQGQCLH